MIKLILKILAAIVAGYFTGLMLGSLFGGVTGFAISLFFLEIVKANLTTLVSIAIAIIAGIGLGSVVIVVINKLFEMEAKSIIGVLVGALAGFVTTIFNGVIANPYPDNIYAETLYLIPIVYGSSIGGKIGVFMYPIIFASIIIRDSMSNYAELKKNRETELERRNELSFYKSKKDID